MGFRATALMGRCRVRGLRGRLPRTIAASWTRFSGSPAPRPLPAFDRNDHLGHAVEVPLLWLSVCSVERPSARAGGLPLAIDRACVLSIGSPARNAPSPPRARRSHSAAVRSGRPDVETPATCRRCRLPTVAAAGRGLARAPGDAVRSSRPGQVPCRRGRTAAVPTGASLR